MSPPPLPRRQQVVPERNILFGSALAVPYVFLVLGFLWWGGGWSCLWRELTTLPCPGCGGTRAFLGMMQGEWGQALRDNPGVVFLVVGLGLLNSYAMAVLLLPIPPWRPQFPFGWRWLVGGTLVLNWIYLLAAGHL